MTYNNVVYALHHYMYNDNFTLSAVMYLASHSVSVHEYLHVCVHAYAKIGILSMWTDMVDKLT